ncbi:MAG: radical SAM protein [Candidatus Hadarchaeota archaeon]
MSAEYSTITCKSALSLSRLPGLRYSLNPYIGCEHGCLYCYSPSVIRDRGLLNRWGEVVRAKENIAEVLAKEVRRREKGTVGVATVTDPYQPLEAKLELTRKCIKILSSHGFDVCIQTKSALVLRDKDLIKPKGFEVGFTITTMDGGIAKKLEPGASPPEARAGAVEELSSRGVDTWIFLGPIIPGLTDSEESIRGVVEAAKSSGSRLIYDKLNLRAGVLERMTPLLQKERPGLAGRMQFLTGKGSKWWGQVSSKVEEVCGEMGVECEPAFPRFFFG